MWEAISTVLKAFTDKYTVPMVAGIVVAIITIIVLPEGFWIINKIGGMAFGVCIAGIVFLLFLLVTSAFKLIMNKTQEAADRRYFEKEKQESIEQSLRIMWNEIDSLSDEERNALYLFLKTDNKPIVRQYISNCGGSIWDSQWFVSTSSSGKTQFVEMRKYKLEENFFQLLKYSYEKYGRISNFE